MIREEVIDCILKVFLGVGCLFLAVIAVVLILSVVGGFWPNSWADRAYGKIMDWFELMLNPPPS